MPAVRRERGGARPDATKEQADGDQRRDAECRLDRKSPASASGRTARLARIVAAVVALALLVAFVLDNSQTVKVGFVFFNANVSLIWVLIIAALLGAAVDRLVILLRRGAGRRSPSGLPEQ